MKKPFLFSLALAGLALNAVAAPLQQQATASTQAVSHAVIAVHQSAPVADIDSDKAMAEHLSDINSDKAMAAALADIDEDRTMAERFL